MQTNVRLREIFHFSFLERMLKVSDPSNYVLKGGINLRFFFNSPRYSEELDLDVLVGSVTTLKKNIYKILQDAAFIRTLRTYGIADIELNDPQKAKQTETTQRFRFGLITQSGLRLPTKVEFSRRNGPDDNSVIEMINPEIARQYRKLAFRCQHYPGELATVQKVQALAGRPATQARDVFDLHLLHAGGYSDSIKANTRLTDEIKQQAIDALVSLTFEDFQGQVIEFLDQENQRLYDSVYEWEAMQESILVFLEDA